MLTISFFIDAITVYSTCSTDSVNDCTHCYILLLALYLSQKTGTFNPYAYSTAVTMTFAFFVGMSITTATVRLF